MVNKCKARWDRGKRVCVQCNLTWSIGSNPPPCRPKWYGEQKLKEIKALLLL